MNRQQRRAAARSRGVGATRVPLVHGRATDPVAPARVHHDAGRYGEAEQAARALLAARPSVGARVVLASSLRAQGRLDEAILEAHRAVAASPTDPVVHEVLGRTLLAQDRVVEAVAAFERALSCDPERPHARLGLGAALLDAGILDRAVEHFRSVIERLPTTPTGYISLSSAQIAMGDFAAARRTVELADKRRLSTDELVWNAALADLGVGDLARAWEGYERGFAVGQRTPDRDPSLPRWQGDALGRRTLLLWREQGIGDEVMFATCLPDLLERAPSVVLEVSPRLVGLFARSYPDVTVRAATLGDRSSVADVHLPLGSLPRFLRPTIDAFDRVGGHLVADELRRAQFRQRLAELGDGPKVGVSWRSMNLLTSRLSHYTTLDELDPVLRLPGLTFVNLQYGDRSLLDGELAAARTRTGVPIHAFDDVDYTDDLEAVAALTAELDLVIGPASFPTVLAGGVGVPAFVFAAPSAWALGTDRDPWFPDSRRFVRPWDQPWAATIARVAAAARAALDAPLGPAADL